MKNQTITMLFLSITVALNFLNRPLVAQTYDVTVNFSTTANPAGVWSYGYLQAGNSPDPATFKLYEKLAIHPAGLHIRRIADNQTDPNVTFNPSSETITQGTVKWASRQVAFHPGPKGEFSVIRWTAPNTGSFSITASFYGISSVPTSSTSFIFHNQDQLFKESINDYLVPHVAQKTVDADKGDTIDFIVSYGDNSEYSSDSTGLTATIVDNSGFGGRTASSSSNPVSRIASGQGVEVTGFPKFAARQQTQVWCWAACIQMILNYNSVNWSQPQVVENTKGYVAFQTATAQEITNFFPRWRFEYNGRNWRGDCIYEPGPPNSSMMLRVLSMNRPLIVGVNRQHVVILYKATYSGGSGQRLPGGVIPQTGNEIITSVTIFDPWTGTDRVIPWSSAPNELTDTWYAWVATPGSSTF